MSKEYLLEAYELHSKGVSLLNKKADSKQISWEERCYGVNALHYMLGLYPFAHTTDTLIAHVAIDYRRPDSTKDFDKVMRLLASNKIVRAQRTNGERLWEWRLS